MEFNLLEETVKDLLEKFGAGNHKPGSGSAAAFQGMVSAKLISTVISLTLDEKRLHYYSDYLDELVGYQNEIESRIYPTLADLFQYDSEQFDKTIQIRNLRNKEKNEIKKNRLRREALEELKISIAIPFRIASFCKEIAEIGVKVFDNGFQSARGDSQVGLSGAVSALAGCISIIRLNVLSFNSDEFEYSKSIVERVNSLDSEYQRLNNLANDKIIVLKDEYESRIPLYDGANKLLKKYRGKEKVDLEQCAKDLQNLVWENKELIWKKALPTNHLDILKPASILKKVLGYDYFSSNNYGVLYAEGEITEVAGVIDQPNKLVVISKDFPASVQNFTSAHELGHAILHDKPIIHRDVPLYSPGERSLRSAEEIQADKFAAYFLLPTKLVKQEFKKIYNLDRFVLNDANAFSFGGRSVRDIKGECRDVHGLSKKLASSDSFSGKSFTSLAKRFNVSVQAMAIRLEEIDLVEY